MKNLIKIALITIPLSLSYADSNVTGYDFFANDPIFRHFQKLQADMDRMFEEFHNQMFKEMKLTNHNLMKSFSSFSPDTDLIDKGDKYVLKMNLAGMDKNSIKIDIKDNYLNVQAKSEEKKEKKQGDKIIFQERHLGVVQRGMTLPKDADGSKYTSDYTNGVLTITIPKKK